MFCTCYNPPPLPPSLLQANNPHEWLQVDFLVMKRITGVVTQGAWSILTQMMVTEFSVTISDNGHSWSNVFDEGTQREKVSHINLMIMSDVSQATFQYTHTFLSM